jgi:hypothetical protein
MLNTAQLAMKVPAQWQGDDVQMKPRNDAVKSVEMENVCLRRRLIQLETEALELQQALERERHRANAIH